MISRATWLVVVILSLLLAESAGAQEFEVSPALEFGGDLDLVATFLVGLRIEVTSTSPLAVFAVAGERVFLQGCDEGRSDCGTFKPLAILGVRVVLGEVGGLPWSVSLGGGATGRFGTTRLMRTGLGLELWAWRLEAGAERLFRRDWQDPSLVFFSVSR